VEKDVSNELIKKEMPASPILPQADEVKEALSLTAEDWGEDEDMSFKVSYRISFSSISMYWRLNGLLICTCTN
jgi:hypothetical protein